MEPVTTAGRGDCRRRRCRHDHGGSGTGLGSAAVAAWPPATTHLGGSVPTAETSAVASHEIGPDDRR